MNGLWTLEGKLNLCPPHPGGKIKPTYALRSVGHLEAFPEKRHVPKKAVFMTRR